MFVKEIFREFFHLFDLEIMRYQSQTVILNQEKEEYIAKNRWLKNTGIQSVLDIGANTGQFAKKIRWIFPNVKIYAFEPIPSVFNSLQDNFKKQCELY
jgi:ubiquinone/menaquinone biosynthesis C-methylase UbiE